jgi:hypothetical protein
MKSSRSSGNKKRSAVRASRTAETFLRQRKDPRQERRFESKNPPGVVGSVIGVSLAAVAAGAGTYGQWLRAEELGPHPWSPYLLGGAAVVMAGVALFGGRPVPAVRVGDAGIGLETDPQSFERIPWCDIKTIRFHDGLLSFEASGTMVSLPVEAHPAAAACALEEAKARIPHVVPSKVSLPSAKGAPAGELCSLEPAQVAGEHCAASGKLIAFDKDARLCGRCGAAFHRASVPRRCPICEAPLK